MRAFLFVLLAPFLLLGDAYVAYDVSGGRFGDHLSDYLHGRWVEYKTGVPMIYAPFAFSDALILHTKKSMIKEEKLTFEKTIDCHRLEDVLHNLSGQENILFRIPHFTGFSIDSVVNVPLGNTYFPKCFLVDWRDKPFLELMREEISPISNSMCLFKPDSLSTSIALHFRDGGGIDKPEWLWCFPLRFPPKTFYKKALSDLIESLPAVPLFIGIFTDSRQPNVVRDEFAQFLSQTFPKNKIEVVLSSSSRGDGAGVLEDFFSIETFDYVIGAESLYSQNAARLGKCLLSIRPQVFAQDHQKGNVFALTGIDMRYKIAKNHQILPFDPKAGNLILDIQAILKRAWYCYKNNCFFDLTLSNPLYERLNFAFPAPMEREDALIVQDEELYPCSDIDWDDKLFLALARGYFVPKMAFKIPVDKITPSVALLDTVNELEHYFSLVEKNGWKKHQVTLVFTGEPDAKKEALTLLYFTRKLKKLGLINVEVKSLSIQRDPLEAFVAIGFHDQVITTPSFLVETAAKLFSPNPAIVVK